VIKYIILYNYLNCKQKLRQKIQYTFMSNYFVIQHTLGFIREVKE
jgi:hypothetical protein